MLIADLPIEIHLHIQKYLTPHDYNQLQLTCKFFSNIPPENFLFEKFRYFVERNDIQQIEIMVKLPLLDTRLDNFWCLSYASAKGYVEIVKILIDNVPSVVIDNIIEFPSNNGHYQVVSLLHKLAAKIASSVFVSYCQHGWLDLVTDCIDKKLIKMTAKYLKSGIERASVFGHLDIVIFLTEFVDLTQTECLCFSCMNGHLSLIEYFLRFIPADIHHNHAIQLACRYGRVEAVERMLREDSVDLNDRTEDEPLLSIALDGSDEEMVLLILDFVEFDENVLKVACSKGWLRVVQRMLDLTFIYENSTAKHLCVIKAAASGHLNVIKLIMKDARMKPLDNMALIAAIENGRVKLVKYLIRECQMDPSVQKNAALKCAIKNKEWEIVKTLYKHPSVKLISK